MTGPVFIDTVGIVAVWEFRDRWHADATPVFEQFVADRTSLVTTSYVLLECGNAATRKPYRELPSRLVAMLSAFGTIIHPTLEDWERGWHAYNRGENASAGIVDQVSIVVMKRLGIERVFSNDRHFAAAGLQTLF